MFTSSIENGYGIEYTNFNLGGTDIPLNGGIAQSVVFDPSSPYIYLPEADFIVVSAELNKIFKELRDLERMNICDTTEGNCFMENSCDYTRAQIKGRPFEMKITLTDEHQQNLIIHLKED